LTLTAAAALLVEARLRFTDVCTEHGFNVFVGQAGFDQLAKLAVAAGVPGLELALSASGHGTEETAMITDLWAAAGGRLSVDEVVARHGYHGPAEGQVSSWSWREDREPLDALLELYRAAGAPPTSGAAGDRQDAERRLLAGLPRLRRAQARATLRFVDVYLPLREVGKAAFLQCIDVGRHAAHCAGQLLVDSGHLDAVDDVQYLTVEDLAGGHIDPETVASRVERRRELLAVDLPDSFVGVPDSWPIDVGAPGPDIGAVRGIAASPGRHKGIARMVRGPEDYSKLDPGDVLLCELTDPGWTPLFAVAGAAVIDIGGPLSHGAIVARELGIPCVIGTGDGSRRIVDGSFVEVDGDTGEVLVL
jgi:pyruvate,water dikinase